MLKNKKAYYFMIDALMAVVIFTVGYFLLTSYYASSAPSLEIQRVSENIMSLISEIRLSDLCDEEGCTIEGMDSIYNEINDKNNTLIESMGELYSTGESGKAAALVKMIIIDNNLIPKGTNFTLSLYNETHYVLIYPPNAPFNFNAKAIIPTKRIIFGSYYK